MSTQDEYYLQNNFTYHAPWGNQQERYKQLRDGARAYAEQVMLQVPPSRERSLALTKIEEAVFWANSAIARNEKEGAPAEYSEPKTATA